MVIESPQSPLSIRRLLSITCLLWMCWGCQSSGGTIVTMTLTPIVSHTDVGTHYAVFALVDDQPILLRSLEIKQVAIDQDTIIKVVRDLNNPELELGVVDGVDSIGRFISGVRFRVSDNLRGATRLYMVKRSNETSGLESGLTDDLLMDCTLEERSLDILSCTLVSPLDKQFILGTASLVLPDESWTH